MLEETVATSTDGQSTVTIPADTTISRSDGEDITLDDLIIESLDSGAVSGLVGGVVIDGVLQWGIPDVELEFDSAINLSIYVGIELNGQTLSIQRSTSGSSDWKTDGINPSTCLVTNGLCSFTTTKASYFVSFHTVSSRTSSRRGGSTTTEAETETVAEESMVPGEEEIVVEEVFLTPPAPFVAAVPKLEMEKKNEIIEPEEIIEAEENFSVVSKQEEELKSSSKQGEELKSPRASPFLAAIYNIFTLGTNDIRIGFMFYFFLGLLIISGFLYLKPKRTMR